MASRRGSSFGAARNSKGASFGDFIRSESLTPKGVQPIRTEFSQGSVPDSIYSANRESAWSRWRRGFEIYCHSAATETYAYPFDYFIPLPPGTVLPPGLTHQEFQVRSKASQQQTKILACTGPVFASQAA